MTKILTEEKSMRKRKKMYPFLFEDPKKEKELQVPPHKEKPLKMFDEYVKSRSPEHQIDPTPRLRRVTTADEDEKQDEEKEYFGESGQRRAPLTPAIQSLVEILKKVLEKHREGIVVKQVAAGREFSGRPFYSKPDIIHFKDFTVGSTYKKKVVLTNVSYSINYCKFIDITERLKDFIGIEFNPPGQMSAGMTCEMMVTFAPKINEDLFGEVKFLSQTGPFSIPLHCTRKKCDLQLDVDTIDFGTTVIGETMRRSFMLTNRGALGTKFDFFKVTGEIGPFSSLRLDIIWQPTIPGRVDSEFLVTFADPLSEGLSLHALANAIDVPVWVERQTVDLKICMFDRLYQDTIIVNNRATTALRLKFEVCKELKNHMEFLPKTGYVQAQSQFSAQLKFLPRQSLFEEAVKYFDRDTGVLEAPMIIRVADQTAPVPFTVNAVVTNSDLEFDVKNIDFGYTTVYESTKTTIKLTNKSILPQEFALLGCQRWYVEVQPNDGFGTLLPLETIELDVIFSPSKAFDYKFDLLSHQVVHFAATALYDVSTASVNVVNHHTSSNEFTHPVPRIGTKGEICPVEPTSYEFVVPPGVPLTVSPAVGTIDPGKKAKVELRFSPTLAEEDIRREAVRMAVKIATAQAEKEYEEELRKEREMAEQALVSRVCVGVNIVKVKAMQAVLGKL
nr:hypothetical protein BaRGS_033457 [Batillaria attramentaria]